MKETSTVTTGLLDSIIARHIGRPGALLSILEEAQRANPCQFLPRENLEYLARTMRVPLTRLYSMVTFYAFFNLKPQGKHTITFCQGTACHTRGSQELFDYAKLVLQLESGEEDTQPITTGDNLLTLRRVACFGQCALAPVIAVDDVIHGHLTKDKLKKIIEAIKRSAEK